MPTSNGKDSGERARLLNLLMEVRCAMDQMMSLGCPHPNIGKGFRGLQQEEAVALLEARELLLAAYRSVVDAPSRSQVALYEVCTSRPMVEHLARAGITTVAQLQDLDPLVLHGLLDQGEHLGAKNQLHLYLFAGRARISA